MIDTPDTTTPAAELVGTNVPEFHAKVREATDLLVGIVEGSVTIWREKKNRRAFHALFTAPPEGVECERIVTIKTGSAWEDTTAPLSCVSSAVTQALGYYWKPVGCYFNREGELGLAKKGEAPKGARLIVLATPHPAGLSR